MKRITALTSILATLALFAVTTAVVPVAYAQDPIAGSSAVLSAHTPETKDGRIEKLTEFLNSHNSPMTEAASAFVEQADKYDLDWKFVAAIAGVESTFGKQIPTNSYNAWGWGIPTGAQSGIGFASWEDGIATVSYGLKTRYIDRGADTIEKIGFIYAPPSTTWAGKVRHFMDKIENFKSTDSASIDLSL